MKSLQDWLTETKAVCDKATEGPWFLSKDNEGDTERVHARAPTGCDEEDHCYNEVGIVKLPVEKYGYGCAWASESNGEFIIYARTALPLALQVIVKLAKALEQISLHEQGLKVARANEALAEVEALLAKNQGDE